MFNLDKFSSEYFTDTVLGNNPSLELLDIKLLELSQHVQLASLLKNSHRSELLESDCKVVSVRNLIDHDLQLFHSGVQIERLTDYLYFS